jgi:hypothetical protein
MLLWEYSADLQPDSGPMTGQRLANQIGFLVAMIGYVVMLAGLHRARVTGAGRFGRFATGAFVTAWVILVLGSVATIVGVDQDVNPLLPIGGLLQTVGGLCAGIVVARAGVWRGWQRWWLLGLASYWLLALFLPLFFGQEPTLLTETGWALSYAGLGAALFTAQSRITWNVASVGSAA